MKCPTPDPLARAHSARLVEHIRTQIDRAGVISFADFMQAALYAPGLGYYASGQHKLGRYGDFMTAPELSDAFAHCLSAQCLQILRHLGGGDILEFGAGSGVLAKDLLLALAQADALPDHYYILEVSADLRERQQMLLQKHCPHLYKRVIWLDQLIQIKGIMLANEVMDAFPVHCFAMHDQTIKERGVIFSDGFRWQMMKPSAAMLARLADVELLDGYQSEMNLFLPEWIKTIAAHLTQGVILLADYGYGRAEYYHPDRTSGTLMCYYQHHRHSDPFVLVGLQDITAHVDFTSVIESAVDAGCTLGGYTTQAGFLLALNILDQLQNTPDIKNQLNKSRMIKTLTLPAEMGEAIKVMALNKNCSLKLNGFQFQSRIKDL